MVRILGCRLRSRRRCVDGAKPQATESLTQADTVQHFLALPLLGHRASLVEAIAADGRRRHRLVAELILGEQLERVGARFVDECGASFARRIKAIANQDRRRAEGAVESAFPLLFARVELPAQRNAAVLHAIEITL